MIDPVELLRGAVAIPSISGSEDGVARFLLDRIGAFADKSWIDEVGNVVATLGRGSLHCFVLGHIDTVPGVVPVEFRDGRLYGRGTVDAKGPFCAAVAAASKLPDEVLKALTLTLIGAVEEEVSSSRGAHHAVSTLPRPDLLVVCEPSGWDGITLGYKGQLWAELSLVAANVHSSTDEPSVAERLVDAWLRIRSWVHEAGPEGVRAFDRIQPHLEDVAVERDGLSVRARAQVGFRLPLQWTPEALAEALSALDLDGVQIDFSRGERAYKAPVDSAVARAFRVAIREEGARPRVTVKTGTADLNVVAPYWPVPMLAYGPGDSGLDHRPDEHIRVGEYLQSIAVWRGALARLAATAPRVRSSSE